LFLSRLEWDLEGFDIPISDFDHHFKPLAEPFQIKYHLALTDYRPKIAILVSGHTHCLADLLYRHSEGDLAGDIVTVISNHSTAKPLADFYRVPFHLLTNPKDKRESEWEMLELLGQDVDVIVLARYMQILGPDFVAQYLLRMINIHHSFLPAFVGAKPYHQAFERGVKLIGVTSPAITSPPLWTRDRSSSKTWCVFLTATRSRTWWAKAATWKRLCSRAPCAGI